MALKFSFRLFLDFGEQLKEVIKRSTQSRIYIATEILKPFRFLL
jgi:hypothetical protein